MTAPSADLLDVLRLIRDDLKVQRRTLSRPPRRHARRTPNIPKDTRSSNP